MGKTILNTALSKISGRIDGWVYRSRHGRLIVAKRPDFSAVVPTQAQLDVRRRFHEAAGYARGVLANPVQRAFYAGLAEGTQSNAFAAALTDWMKPPQVTEVDLSGYHGAVGDPVKVKATDDTGVVAVTVVLRDGSNAVLEQGPATSADGGWTYAATTAVPAGTAITVEAVAKDRPGHEARQTVPFVVG